MKKSVFRILVYVLILSLIIPGAHSSVRAEGHIPPTTEIPTPKPEFTDFLPEKVDLEHHFLPEPAYPPELAERFPGEGEITEPREYTPPSPEVIALTQQQVQSFECSTVTDIPQNECEALVALYNSTNGAGWTDHTNWLVNNQAGTWYGVTVSSGHVIELSLWVNQLTGPIPPEVGNLSNLYYLFLGGNQLTGPIPPELGNLSNLQVLDLDGNQLTGPIPPELGNLSNLEYLDLWWNQLTGPIPPEVGNLSNLQFLYLVGNQLTGPIPSELGNLSNLEYLALGSNQLTGPIPLELVNLSNLYYLDLGGNQLTGLIPPELGNLSNLEYLALERNQLTGPIPPELGNLSYLQILDLGGNQLTGPIPPQLGNLSNLDYLFLGGNQLTGPIPPELGNLSNLRRLALRWNQLTGPIPLELGNLSNLQILDLGGNQLTGPIPPELGNLINLISLDLSENLLEGDVPPSFVNLVNLCEAGNPDPPCYGNLETDLGYNRLNVPAPEPPANFLAIKDPDWYLTQAVEEEIPGETGGTVVSNDGNTEIAIPPGAVDGAFTILFAPQPDPSQDIGVLNFTGNSFELTASIGEDPVTSFEEPLTLTLQYDEASLGVIPEDTLRLYYWDTDQLAWVDAVSTCESGSYTRNMEEDWLSLPLCHLSEFALLGDSFDLFLPTIRR